MATTFPSEQDLERQFAENDESGTTDEETETQHVSQLESALHNSTAQPSHDQKDHQPPKISFFSRPFFTSLLLPNNFSEARDADAAERNFLSWLKVSVYLSIAGTAVIINIRFHDRQTVDSPPTMTGQFEFLQQIAQDLSNNLLLKDQYALQSVVETKDYQGHQFSLPLGFIFYSLSLLAITVSMVNYVSTINGYLGQKVIVTNSFLTTLAISLIAFVILISNIIVLCEFY